ncbi:MAG: suppressor of fused domain protein [Nannocystis sp.]|nr:suppressor of fused domain protein [Nannocystis sp.]MBA3549933.1 suppressor of fused domain protein [Nannocystis sp.]
MAGEQEAPGWAAIDAALARLYGRQVPHQFASQTAYELDTPSPLPAIAVYEGVRPLHWHFVSYGLSELFEKSSEDPNVSGFGFELTMRTPRAADETTPPAWPLRALQGLGRYVLGRRQGFDTGHCAELGGSIAQGQGSALTCLACVPDPLLGKINTPFGSLLFLQVVGITADELAAMQRLDHEGVVNLLGELDFHGITDPTRSSYFNDPGKAPVLRRYQLGVLRDR